MADYILKYFDRKLIRFSAKDTGETSEVCITYIDQEALPLMSLGMDVTGSGLARWLKHRKILKTELIFTHFGQSLGYLQMVPW